MKKILSLALVLVMVLSFAACGSKSETPAASGSSSSSSDSSSSGDSGSVLRQGSRSDAVRTLQEDLKTLGFYTGSVTGNFGNLTKEAVYNFQKANNLSADGVAGAKTLAKIASAMAGSISARG